MAGVFLLLLCGFLAAVQGNFASVLNLQNLGRQSAVLVVISVGLLFVLLVGGIDLSIGGQIAFTAVVAASLANRPGWSVPAAFICAIAVSGLVGLINGALVGAAGLSPIVVTLASGQVLLGLALLTTQSGPIQAQNPAYGDLANASLGPVPWLSIEAGAAAVVAYLLLRRVSFGRYVYAVGGNETAAWLAGVPTRAVQVGVYTLCGLFAGIAGAMLSSRVLSGDATLGSGVMLDAFAAAFIGGVGFGTGRGKVSGVVIGALILGVAGNGLNLAGYNTDLQYIVSGVLIVLAIALQRLPGALRRRARS